jgi:hypothetical protein
VAFDDRSWRHLEQEHPELLDEVQAVLAAIAAPDFRQPDPQPGRERFYQRRDGDQVRWLRVVVDFNERPAFVVTAFIQRNDPQGKQ